MKKLTIEEARNEVAKIKNEAEAAFFEEAHILEYEIKERFVYSCANQLYDSPEELTEVAKVVQESSDLEYERWFA